MTAHVRRMLRDARGLSLVEIAIACAIIGVGLVALSSAIPFASYGIHEGSHLSTATFLANQRLEQVRNARWEAGPPAVDQLGVSASATAAPAAGGAPTFPDETPVAAPYAGYSRVVRITSCAGGCNGIADAGLRQVTVTVTYRPMTGQGMSADGTVKPATITMYIARR